MSSSVELLKKVRRVEIKTKRLSHQIFAGEYHSAFKGRGMAFSEVREYQPGDDVRSMDWNVTAKLNSPFVKIYEEERELTVILLIDVSGSRMFGTQSQTKQELATEIGAVLSFSASANNDKVGAIFFSSKVEKFIPPKKGRTHLLRILREMIEFEPEEKGTDVGAALQFLANAIKKRCTAFLISDLMDSDGNQMPRFEKPLRIASNRHEIFSIIPCDVREKEIPDIGFVKVFDAETGCVDWVDTSNKSVRESYSEWRRVTNNNIDKSLRQLNISFVRINTGEDFVRKLMSLFKKR